MQWCRHTCPRWISPLRWRLPAYMCWWRYHLSTSLKDMQLFLSCSFNVYFWAMYDSVSTDFCGNPFVCSDELIGAYSSNDLTNNTKYAEFELLCFKQVLQLLLIYNLNMCFLAVVLASKCIAPYSGSGFLDTTACPPQNVHPKLSLFSKKYDPPRSQGWGRISEKHEVDCLRVRSKGENLDVTKYKAQIFDA